MVDITHHHEIPKLDLEKKKKRHIKLRIPCAKIEVKETEERGSERTIQNKVSHPPHEKSHTKPSNEKTFSKRHKQEIQVQDFSPRSSGKILVNTKV